jgi:hypothetical protein
MARTTFSGPIVAGKEETTTSKGSDGEIKLLNKTNGKLVSLKASTAVSADVTFTLPALDGTAGQAVVTNGAGVLSFGDIDPEDPVVTLPSAATIEVDYSTGSQFAVTLADNATFNITNFPTGGNLVITITQDGTGGRTGAFTSCIFPGGFPALSLAANDIDVVTVYNDGTSLLANIGKDYQ